MNPKDQLTDSNTYNPSERARKAQSIAGGRSGYTPDHAEPSPTGDTEPAAAKMPSNPAGGKAPADRSGQSGSAELDNGTGRGNVTGKNKETGNL